MNIDRIAVARLIAEALLHILHGEKEKAVTLLQLVLSALLEDGELL